MKKILFIISAVVALAFSQKAEAKGVIIYHNGPTIETVAQLPDDAKIDNSHVNIGVMYDQFGLFWMPIWNYGETKYVLVNDAEDTYWDIDDQTKAIIKEDYGSDFDFSKAATPSLWNKIGLKPLILLLILWGAYDVMFKKKKKEEEPVFETKTEQSEVSTEETDQNLEN